MKRLTVPGTGILLCLGLVLLTACNCPEKTGLMDLLGKEEAVVVEHLGPPLQTSGKEFGFYEPGSGRKMLFYKLEEKNVVFTIIQGQVTDIGLVPDPPG